MKCKHVFGKVLHSNIKYYHYTCIKCNSNFSKSQIEGYEIKLNYFEKNAIDKLSNEYHDNLSVRHNAYLELLNSWTIFDFFIVSIGLWSLKNKFKVRK